MELTAMAYGLLKIPHAAKARQPNRLRNNMALVRLLWDWSDNMRTGMD
jgi:hypothetical protein